MHRTLATESCGCRVVEAVEDGRADGVLILRCPLHEAAPYLLWTVELYLHGDTDPAARRRAARMAHAWATEAPSESRI
jgi:hypothetical protein